MLDIAAVKIWYDSFNGIHPVVLWHINIDMYYRQKQQTF